MLDNLWARHWLPATFFIAATMGVLGVALLVSGNGLAAPSCASLLLGTEPVWAVATGIGLGGDHLTATGALGALMIICATYAGQHVERRHRRTGPPSSAAPEQSVDAAPADPATRQTQRSARRIIPELQGLAVGDVVPKSPDGKQGINVCSMDPPQ